MSGRPPPATEKSIMAEIAAFATTSAEDIDDMIGRSHPAIRGYLTMLGVQLIEAGVPTGDARQEHAALVERALTLMARKGQH